MNVGENHIIDKFFLEVNTASEKTAYRLKNNADYFLNNFLLPRLEELLDDYDTAGSFVRFDELHLDLFISEWTKEREIVQEFENNLCKKLEKELIVSQPIEKARDNKRQISATRNREDVFLFFLENGFLPWYGRESYISKLIKKNNWNEVIQQKNFREKLATLFSQNENALKRFALQFPSEIVIDYLVALQPEKKGLKKKLQYLLTLFPEKLRIQVLQIALQLSFQKENEIISKSLYLLFSSILKTESGLPNSEKAFRELKDFVSEYFPEKNEIETVNQSILGKYEQNELRDYLAANSDLKEAEQKIEQETDESFFEKKTSEVIVKNAGLVLLHPFLKTFFTETGILTKVGYFLKEKQMLAVQALHFLATGNEMFFEANMVFEKYLSGMPLKMPIQRESLLTKEIKSEANEMLSQVIKHWPALKNTSTDGLRQNFLQRDGKLIQNEKNYRLLVERKTQDILLERIDWNISVVKLPWMKNLIHVEW